MTRNRARIGSNRSLGSGWPHVAGLSGANKPGAKPTCEHNCDRLAPALLTWQGGSPKWPLPANGAARCRLGAVAQLGERLVRNEEVRGSIPLGSTTPRRRLGRTLVPRWWAGWQPDRALVVAHSRQVVSFQS